NQRPALETNPNLNSEKPQNPALLRQNNAAQFAPNHNVKTEDIDKQNLPPQLVEMIKAIEALIERLTGKSYTLKVMGYQPEEQSQSQPENIASNSQTPQQATPNLQDMVPSTGERWSFHSTYQEVEQTRFQAQGRVTTADGREINFDLKAQMYRNFSSQLHIAKEQGVVLKDPLVINFAGTPANLTVDKFNFDIDADGNSEQISFVDQNSGFLAFDKNQDGVINNGSELFGALTGNGFDELAQFDEDGNGWIDENDSIFSKLQVWQKDSHGFDQLSGLLEMNIGAISLNHIETQFSLKDDSNQQHGQITNSGVFLKESGGAGTIQQIDLVV
ncbi:MAG: hypothetical protein R3254_07185, partial [Thiomicrorhabdus sp.]|nr:hypothetical protein [Thiomicrorhabdus sp.]